jgi:serine/threonine protein kinase/tetratricopeptide (TPR) repeat protein
MGVDPAQAIALFQAALELASPAERVAYLDRECGDDAELRARVEALLADDGAGPVAEPNATRVSQPELPATQEATRGSVPGSPVPSEWATGEYSADGEASTIADTQPDSGPSRFVAGQVIAGRYTLLELLGEGGMGTVYLADQTDPVKRQVALKLIKVGMDSRSVLARFDAERQALALMDHPNIARVFDGGTTAAGQPFFVMELVKGVPITQYCDHHRLPVRARLELFATVCQAVQHAHQKGIIHRDLKPSNVMVTEVDGRPTPKVIDFGVAKATEFNLTDQSLADTGAIVGTPTYMSPEQADPSSMDIDTRTDVYALGVILYELLAGSPPLDASQFKRGAFLEMLRMVREVDPPRPSIKVSTSHALPNIAASRDVDPERLKRTLRGDLDWIVMKALEKDRTRRYETANGFAADVLRHLASEPVLAAPPSRVYLTRKFVRKNQVAVIAASLVVLALVGGIVGTTWGLIREANANASLAAKNLELADEKAKVQARFNLAQKAIATFHTGVSEDALLKNAQLSELRNKLLKEAARFYRDLEKLLEGQTDVRSRQALAAGYFQLGELTEKIGAKPEALATHLKGLEVRRELASLAGAHVETRLDVASSLRAVGDLLMYTGDTEKALRVYEERRDFAAALEVESPTDTLRAVLAESYSDIGVLRWRTGKLSQAIEAYGKSLAMRQKLADANPTITRFQTELAGSHNNIAIVLSQTGKPVEALVEYRQALSIRQKLADANPTVSLFQYDLAKIEYNIGYLLSEMGRLEEALEALGQALAIRRRLADASPAVNEFQSDLADCHNAIGILLSQTGKPAEALAAQRESLSIRQKLADAYPADTSRQYELASSYNYVGTLLGEMRKLEEAIEAHGKALSLQQKLADAYPTETSYQNALAWTHNAIGAALMKTGKPAAPSFRRALAIMERLPTLKPSDRYNLACYYARLAGVTAEAGSGLSNDEAKAAADKAMDTLRRAFADGFYNVRLLRSDSDLDSLRNRQDFKTLMAELEKLSLDKPEEKR